MKSEFNTKVEEKKFEPFSVTITAETIEDARLLWHLFNSNQLSEVIISSNLYNFRDYSKNITYNLGSHDKIEIWRKINDHIINSGYEV